MAEPTTQATSTPTGTYAPGAFVWHEYATHDVAAAKRFYGGLPSGPSRRSRWKAACPTT